MKTFILGLTVILTATIATAQKNSLKPTVFSIGLETSLPVGDFHNFHGFGYNFGAGVSGQVAHKIASDLSLTLYAGYMNYTSKTSGTGIYHLSVIPVLAGAKFWLSPKVYAQGQLGVAFNSTKQSNSNLPAYKTTGFAYSPGLGFVIAKNIDFLIKYFENKIPNRSSYSSFGARVAYNFLKK